MRDSKFKVRKIYFFALTFVKHLIVTIETKSQKQKSREPFSKKNLNLNAKVKDSIGKKEEYDLHVTQLQGYRLLVVE